MRHRHFAITNHDGVVYQQDLGPDTERIASEMTEFDPGPGWTPVSNPPTSVPSTQPAASTQPFASSPPQDQQ